MRLFHGHGNGLGRASVIGGVTKFLVVIHGDLVSAGGQVLHLKCCVLIILKTEILTAAVSGQLDVVAGILLLLDAERQGSL